MITLRKIDQKTIWDVVALSVADEQTSFVATNTESILEAYVTLTAGGVALPFGVYADETPVGFVMLGYDAIPGEDAPAVAKGNYCIWRFMIDKRYQGRGYAKDAMRAILAYIRTFPCGKATLCYLSYEPENTRAAALYHAFGFAENGEYDGDEIVACLPL